MAKEVADELYEKVEEAVENVEASKQHRDKADRLAEEAEDRLTEQLEDELDDETLVDVEAEYEDGVAGLYVELFNQRFSDALNEVVGEDLNVALAQPLSFIIRDDDSIESSKTRRDRIQNLRGIIADMEGNYDEGAPIEKVLRRSAMAGIGKDKAESEIEKLKQKGEVYEPRTNHLRTT